MEEFVNERLAICRECAIVKHTKDMGMQCNGKLWLNPETNEASAFYKDGWVKGCNCFLNYKAAHVSNHCPAKKW